MLLWQNYGKASESIEGQTFNPALSCFLEDILVRLKPLLSRHLWDLPKCPLSRGWWWYFST